MDSSLKYKCTLKISTSYLLPFSRNRQNSICKSKRIYNMLNYSYKYTYNYMIMSTYTYFIILIRIHVSLPFENCELL